MRAVFEVVVAAAERRGAASLCARLTVFRGGWTAEAAEQVAEVSPRVLTRLLRKSMVRWSEPLGTSERYQMLEPLRRWWQSGWARKRDVAERHSTYYLRFVAAQERRPVREVRLPAPTLDGRPS